MPTASSSPSLQDCITTCWECRTTCLETLYTYCLDQGGMHVAKDHVQAMTDCIAICQQSADFMTRQSPLHASVCQACADICDACADSCAAMDDERMQKCADICRACAQSCRAMSQQTQRRAA